MFNYWLLQVAIEDPGVCITKGTLLTYSTISSSLPQVALTLRFNLRRRYPYG